MEETPTPTAPPSPLWTRVFRTFVEPARLGDELALHPRWGSALVLGAALAALSALLIPAEIWQEMMREQALASGRSRPEGADVVGSGFFRAFAIGGGLVGWSVWAFLLSGIVTLVFAFVLGDEGRYRQYLALTCHALLIGAVGALVTVPLKLARSDPQLTLSVGTFFAPDEGYGARLLRGMDLFMIWSYVVLGIGVSRLDERRSEASAIGILLVFAVGLAALFAIFPGMG